MSTQDEGHESGGFNFYGPQYARFGSGLAAELRREVYGEDLGQQGWRTAAEQAEIAQMMGPRTRTPMSSTLPAARAAPRWRWSSAPDANSPALILRPPPSRTPRPRPSREGWRIGRLSSAWTAAHPYLSPTAASMPFCASTRSATFRTASAPYHEWARLLRPGGRLVFTDPAVLSGAVAKSEFDIRAIGFFLVVPPGLDEAAIQAAGLTLLRREDRTAAIAEIAAAGTPPASGAPTSWSARREPIGSCSGNASSRPRPSWPEAVGSHASSSSPRNQCDRKVGPSSAGERHPTPVSG